MFEKRELTRKADPDELDALVNRHLDVLYDIDRTTEEAKNAATEYRGLLKGLRKKELGLRLNLQQGTVTVEVEVQAVANLHNGEMEYFDRNGLLIADLTHPLSQSDQEHDAWERQLGMFSEAVPAEEGDQLISTPDEPLSQATTSPEFEESNSGNPKLLTGELTAAKRPKKKATQPILAEA